MLDVICFSCSFGVFPSQVVGYKERKRKRWLLVSKRAIYAGEVVTFYLLKVVFGCPKQTVVGDLYGMMLNSAAMRLAHERSIS